MNINVGTGFPTPANTAVKCLISFARIYFGEAGLPVLLDGKSKKRHKFEVKDDMRLNISVIQRDITRLVSSQKQRHFCHQTTEVRKYIATGIQRFMNTVQALKHFKQIILFECFNLIIII
jgi:hypothetical protein